MRKLLNTILRMLDGTPQRLQGRERGQTLMEMAFITPVLIVMVVGIVEIGWYANNYLILLEVTRVGARQGTVLTGDLSPLSWVEPATTHPIAYLLNNGYTTSPSGSGFNGMGVDAGMTADGSAPADALNFRDCSIVGQFSGFYNFIACTMIESLDPLTLKGRAANSTDPSFKSIRILGSSDLRKIPIPDDIVISVFSLQSFNNADPAITANPLTEPEAYRIQSEIFSRTYDFEDDARTQGKYPPGHQVRVVGRYPTNANECNVWFEPVDAAQLGSDLIIDRILAPLYPLEPGDSPQPAPPAGAFSFDDSIGTDPFDYFPSNTRDTTTINGRLFALELAGFDTGAEFQRGFVWTGQRVVRETDGNRQLVCLGSTWTNEMVEEFMNSPLFLNASAPSEPQSDDYPDTGSYNDAYAAYVTERDNFNALLQERSQYLPSQGMVLVEMTWGHDLLLDFPFFATLLQMFGDTQNVQISVWAAFPVPSVEPNIIFGLPPS